VSLFCPGSARGARHLAQLCADIETRAKTAEFDVTSECLDGLQREFTRACAALTANRDEI
jgi:HPt (histidine-containing phosphotransfer) domain-containing protein